MESQWYSTPPSRSMISRRYVHECVRKVIVPGRSLYDMPEMDSVGMVSLKPPHHFFSLELKGMEGSVDVIWWCGELPQQLAMKAQPNLKRLI